MIEVEMPLRDWGGFFVLVILDSRLEIRLEWLHISGSSLDTRKGSLHILRSWLDTRLIVGHLTKMVGHSEGFVGDP